MRKKSAGKRLAKVLARNHDAGLKDADRHNMEQMLGPGSIRFKLDRAGTGLLFSTLGQATNERDKPDGNPL